MMDLLWRRAATLEIPQETYVAVIKGMPYHVIPDDPLYAGAQAAAAGMGVSLVYEPVPPVPTEAERLAELRAAAWIDRGPLCLALYGAGILSAASALAASRGDWPSEFAPFLSSMTAGEQLAAQISWADATTVRYENPLLQGAALIYTSGNAAAATAMLDSLFGVS